jgi:hypothetical protein
VLMFLPMDQTFIHPSQNQHQPNEHEEQMLGRSYFKIIAMTLK